MLYKQYGKTGKKISAIAFGGMRFDKPEDIDAQRRGGAARPQQGHQLLRHRALLLRRQERGHHRRGHDADRSRGTFYVSTKCGDADGDGMPRRAWRGRSSA